MMTIQQFDEALKRDRESNPRMARLQDKLHNCYLRETYRLVRELFDWPTQANTARLKCVDRVQIGRWIKKGKLGSKGMSGWICRVDPSSLVQLLLARFWEERAKDDAWARGELT